jgi:hypothetical protein
MTTELERYKRRWEKARANAYQWWPMLEAAYHYCVPGRNMFYYTNQARGQQKNVKVYDTTQVAATKSFVSKVQESLTPPQQNWAYLEPGEGVPKEQEQDVAKILQQYTDIIFSFIRGSNFDLAINECYYDLGVGTAVLVCNEGDDDDPLQFSSIPLDQVAIEESANHKVETVFRCWKEIKILDIPEMWPNANIPSHLIERTKEDPTATIKDLIEGCVYRHDDKRYPYRYTLWHDDDLMLDEERESTEFIVFRWSKINNETFGRGPIIDALPSILSLQTAAYFEMTAANLNICKPYMAFSDGVFNPYTFRIAPNTVIPISPNTDGVFPIQPLPDVANPAFMQLTSMDLRQQINKLMFADPLGPVNEAPTRTATELALRQRNLAEEIGPIFTRLQQEFLERTIQRVIHILQKKGFLDKLIINDREVKIKYRSPLTISQGQQDVDTFMNYLNIMQGFVGPEMTAAYVNTVKFSPWLASKLGVDQTLINTEDQMQAQLQRSNDELQQLKMMEVMNAQQA